LEFNDPVSRAQSIELWNNKIESKVYMSPETARCRLMSDKNRMEFGNKKEPSEEWNQEKPSYTNLSSSKWTE
jgi:hypothetical protein